MNCFFHIFSYHLVEFNPVDAQDECLDGRFGCIEDVLRDRAHHQGTTQLDWMVFMMLLMHFCPEFWTRVVAKEFESE
jgi:hypothetical protein